MSFERPTYKAAVSLEIPDWTADNGHGEQDFSLSIEITLRCRAQSAAFDYQGPFGLATGRKDEYSPDEGTVEVVEVEQCNSRIDQDGGDHPTRYEIDFRADAEWLAFIAKYHVDSKGKPIPLDWEIE